MSSWEVWQLRAFGSLGFSDIELTSGGCGCEGHYGGQGRLESPSCQGGRGTRVAAELVQLLSGVLYGVSGALFSDMNRSR